MIRLNRMFEKARRRRGLWLILVVLFALLLGLVALHTGADATMSDGPLVCVAIMLIVALVVAGPLAPDLVSVAPALSRGPPRLSPRHTSALRAAVTSFAPLRL